MNKWIYSPKLCQVTEHQTQSENAGGKKLKTAINRENGTTQQTFQAYIRN